jgi:hypothetical protein
MRHWPLLATAAVCIGIAGPGSAGTFFRLEVGPPVAAGTAVKDKKTALVVRPRLCDDAASVQIAGTAEGLVHGVRQSIALRIVPLSTPGVHAVSEQWSRDGAWIVHLTAICPATGAVTSALVPMNGSTFVRQKIELMPQRATREQVEAAIAAHAGLSR